MDKYQQAEQLDVKMILDALDGKSLRRYPRFHAKGIPTYRGVLELAQKHGITRGDKIEITTSTVDAYENPQTVFNVISTVVLGNRSLLGAARHADAYVALERSFQNGVRQILFQEDIQ